ncbi:MAG: ribosome hibernation-promoting factor, HPF/YfiA family [Candidatus Scatovivens sp.]
MINLIITDKELKATEAIKDYIEKKMPRLDKYLGDEEIDVNVKIKSEKNLQIAEIYFQAKGTSFKAVTEGKDLYASIDKNIDILEGQFRKIKTKKEREQKEASIKQTVSNSNLNNIENEVIKVINYDIKPISIEDAKLILEEKVNNQFLTFINIETGKVNVIYKLKDNVNFGLVEPEK